MKNMKMAVGTLAILGSVASSACGPIVLDPIGQNQSNAVAPDAGSDAGAGETTLAMPYSAWSQAGTETPGYCCSGAAPAPDTEVLFFSSRGLSCADPGLSPPAPGALECGVWELVVLIPAALLKPGKLSLDDTQLSSFFNVSLPGAPGTCGGGGGSPATGAIELVSVGAGVIDVVLSGTGGSGVFSADGSYSVSRCQ